MSERNNTPVQEEVQTGESLSDCSRSDGTSSMN